MEALRVWPTIDQDVTHECTQRKEREWWEGDKHIVVIAMCVCVCLMCMCINYLLINGILIYVTMVT